MVDLRRKKLGLFRISGRNFVKRGIRIGVSLCVHCFMCVCVCVCLCVFVCEREEIVEGGHSCPCCGVMCIRVT